MSLEFQPLYRGYAVLAVVAQAEHADVNVTPGYSSTFASADTRPCGL